MTGARRLPMAVAVAGLVIAHVTSPVRAVDDDARLEVTPITVHAGLAVTVRGLELDEQGTLVLRLVGPDGTGVDLATVDIDQSGGFDLAVTIPEDTAVGRQTIRLDLQRGRRLEAPITVTAAPLPQGEQRGRDEPLLVPPPSTAPLTHPRPATGASPAEPSGSQTMEGLVLLGLLIAGLLIALVAASARARWGRGGRDIPG